MPEGGCDPVRSPQTHRERSPSWSRLAGRDCDPWGIHAEAACS